MSMNPVEPTPAKPAKFATPESEAEPAPAVTATPSQPAEAALPKGSSAGSLDAHPGGLFPANPFSPTYLSALGPIIGAIMAKTLHFPIQPGEIHEAVQHAVYAAKVAHEMSFLVSTIQPTAEALAEKLYGYEAADWPTEAEPWRPWSAIPDSAKEPRIRVAAMLLADFVVLPKR